LLFSFEDFTLDCNRRELRRGEEAIAVEPQVFDLLVFVIRNRDRVVSRDDLIASVWRGRIVSESTLASRINAARNALGDDGETQRLIRTIHRKGIRFVGEVHENNGATLSAPARSPVQDVTFCRTDDGVHLAVGTSGDGPPIVKTANWLNHIEYDWQSPVWQPLIATLSDRFRLVRYDERGNGLSDWDVDDISFEAFVSDLEAVVEASGLERFALFGISQGAAVSIAYATQHPERVSHLVLSGGYALGWRKHGDPDGIAQREALESLVRHGWGQDNPAFRQVFTSLYIPDGTPEQMQWFNDLQRISTSPDNAARILRALENVDVTDLLPKVSTPTLVLHSRGDARVPFDQGLALARGIPGARFVELNSNNHLILPHEPAWDRYITEITSFLAGDMHLAAS